MLKFLKSVPFIVTAVSYVTSSIRLAIEYILIGLIIACTASAITLWYHTQYLETRNDELREHITDVEVINETQDKTISDLQELRKQDAAVMAGLVTDYAKLSKADATARKKLSELEKQNAHVRDYLDQPLPPELVCMLNSSCTGSEAGGAGSQGSAAEQPTKDVQQPQPEVGAHVGPLPD